MSHNNSINIIHENSFGHIAKCKCCDDIQIKFGNAILSFDENEFREFNSFFNEIRKDFELEVEDTKSEYFVRTYLCGLTLSFTYYELQQAIELLALSNIMISVSKLIVG